ncbi:succinylglutamate desuccinylase/aspartoacylase family protein [Aquamicrobium sp. LC103]|uniref:succinylglutamate desuccinylase/aspartoacylase family protein n=1 Tax=Aquamicrobium sp. LC103 TaxID=1120658 RepID=UPI00063EA1B4|nr:succinylglutamate desuccinylase/aspartoacylase family protein [Aquamicrobium sp. LC103]TKT74590.1 N-alpha-acetyl diaminobutyric acid deacetylase DoeB [Aquamicrobium sp. LC103]
MLPAWSPVHSTIDLDAPGKRFGKIVLPLPGLGETVEIPIAVFARGEGPTVLMTGAVHGDEYDGPITLLRIARSLELDHVNGRLIIVPVLNQLAMRAGQRVAPIDRLDLNRSFPGDPEGRPSEILAHWLATRLVPIVDAVVDAHTGGSFTNWVPLAMMHPLADADQHRRTMTLIEAMRPPLGVVIDESDKPGMFDTYVERRGKIFVCCEFGGGTMTRRSLDVAGVCLRNALRHFNMLPGELETPVWPEFDGPRILQAADLDWVVASRRDGIYEPVVELGQAVAKGQVLGYVHPIDDLEAEPAEARAPIDGVLIFRPASSRVEKGTRLGMIARDL